MNILVTGGAGYIGSVLVERLLTHPPDPFTTVTVLDNFMYGGNSLGHLCCYDGLRIVRGDACEPVISIDIKPFDVIIPLAAIVGAAACNARPKEAKRVNQDAIWYLCHEMRPHQALIIPITNSGYGIGQPGVPCTEESPLNPVSLYGKTKVEAERIAMQRENSISLRLATVFGMSPRMRMDLLVNDLVWRAMKDRSLLVFEGHFMRNYVHVQDVARAFLHAIDNFAKMRGQVYNVGDTRANMSKLELCAKIKRHLPEFTYIEAAIGEDPDKRDYIVSNAKIEATGWQPNFALDSGIRELIKGYTSLSPMRYCNA